MRDFLSMNREISFVRVSCTAFFRSVRNAWQLDSRPLIAPFTADCMVGPAPATTLCITAHRAAKRC
jgi:hypothetical protein